MAVPAPHRVDAHAELRGASMSRFHWMLTGVVLLITIFDGYDTLNASYVIHYVVKPWGLSHSQTGFLVSAGLIGFAVGALAHGPIADRYGRRPVLVGALFLAGAGSLLTAVLANSFVSFIALRGFTGLGLGVLMPLGTAYINEFAPDTARSRMVSIAQSGYAFGGVFASGVGIWLTPAHGWQILYWVGGASVPLAIALWWLLPESVEYLAMRDRQTEAIAALRRIRRDRVYEGAALAEPRHERARTGEIVRSLLSWRYQRTTIILWICAFMVLFDIYGLAGWMPTLMEARGSGFGESFSFGALLQIGGIAGGLCVALLDDGGRADLRRGMIGLQVVSVAAVILVALVDTTVTNMILVLVAGFGIIGGQFVLNNLCARSYPTNMRGTGVGAMFGVGRVGGILGPYVGGWLLGWFDGNNAVLFYAVAIAAAVAALSMFALGGQKSAVPVPAEQSA